MNGRPIGITIIAILMILSGAAGIILGLESAGVTNFGLLQSEVGVTTAAGWAQVIVGAITLLVGLGLFTLAGWAWMIAVVVLIVRIALDIWVMLTHGFTSTIGVAAILDAVIAAIIVWYFNRVNVRAAFGH